jgi:hypothetical protein
MRNRWTAILAALAVAALFAVPAGAGDGDGSGAKSGKAAGGSKEAPKGKDGECKEAAGSEAKGGECEKQEGEKDKAGLDVLTVQCVSDDNDCSEGKPGAKCVPGCTGKQAPSDLEVVALAAVEGANDAAKKVWASVPAATVAKVEEARKAAFDRLIEIQKAMEDLRKDFADACAESKEKGREVACDAKDTYARDVKVLHGKAMAQVAAFSKVLGDSLGEEKVKELSGECRKAGDMCRAAGAKVRAAALKFLEKKAAAKDEDGEDDDDADEDGEDDGPAAKEHGKGHEKGHDGEKEQGKGHEKEHGKEKDKK